MTRAQVFGLSSGSAVLGGVLLIFVVFSVPPEMPDGAPNTAALAMALLSAMLLIGGLSAMLALALHRRWPKLAGAEEGVVLAEPSVAMRQGALVAVGAGFMMALHYRQMLDAAFFIVTILMLILFEAFVQSRT